MFAVKQAYGGLFMRYLLWDRMTAERHEDSPERGLDRYDPSEIDPPEPWQIFTRLGVLLAIALAFGLAAELLARLPLN
jgi:hypothetical protein